MRLASVLLLVAITGCASSPESVDKNARSFTTRSFGAVWDDPTRCLTAVRHGRRLPKKDGLVRVGTWNIRWFPDGWPGEAAADSGTSIPWVACAIAYTQTDLFALQEIKLTKRGLAAMDRVTRELEVLTGAPWHWRADACKKPGAQHTAVLYRADHIAITGVRSHGVIDPTQRAKGSPGCPGKLRPALGAYVKSKRGGVDFHFASIHLDSGRDTRDFENRKAAWERIQRLAEHRASIEPDADLILAGDFNMMGCEGCEVTDDADERQALMQVLRNQEPAWATPAPSVGCTEYYKGKGGLLDQIIYTRAMREARGATQHISGICGAAECAPMGAQNQPYFQELSDHCPVLMDILDADRDDSDGPPSAPRSEAENAAKPPLAPRVVAMAKAWLARIALHL
mgnify:CR=1 FL=1